MTDRRVKVLVGTRLQLEDDASQEFAVGEVYMVSAEQADAWLKAGVAVDPDKATPVNPLQCLYCSAVAPTDYLLKKHVESNHAEAAAKAAAPAKPTTKPKRKPSGGK